MSTIDGKTFHLASGCKNSTNTANVACPCQCYVDKKADKTDGNPVLTLGITFGISVILVIIISYIKYRLDKEGGFRENMMFYSELPIDINTVAITILLTYYDKVSNMEVLFFFMFLSILLSLIMTTLRRSLLNVVERKECWTWKSFFCIAGECILLLVSLIMIFKVIIR